MYAVTRAYIVFASRRRSVPSSIKKTVVSQSVLYVAID